jgi:cell division protein FtsQ
MMPLKPGHPVHLLIANGTIPDRFLAIDKTEKPISALSDTSALRQIYPVAYHIAGDEFLRSFVDQVYVNESGELELVPKLGHQVIMMGDGQDAAEKLENLKMFYLRIMNKINWNTYKTINLKYKNQVVCSK